MTLSLTQLETEVEQLSFDEQMQLMEHLIQAMRRRTLRAQVNEFELVAMAADPDIQRELAAIDTEFRSTESDGLDQQ
jgi:aspartyl/asparaginyl-tRNA synthetase